MELNFEGIAVGAASLLVIGAFHPLVGHLTSSNVR